MVDIGDASVYQKEYIDVVFLDICSDKEVFVGSEGAYIKVGYTEVMRCVRDVSVSE